MRGRKTGEPRRTPVNPLTLDDTRYLVAARGHNSIQGLDAVNEQSHTIGRQCDAPFSDGPEIRFQGVGEAFGLAHADHSR